MFDIAHIYQYATSTTCTVFLYFTSLGSAIALHKHVKEVESLFTRLLSVCFPLHNKTLSQGSNLLLHQFGLHTTYIKNTAYHRNVQEPEKIMHTFCVILVWLTLFVCNQRQAPPHWEEEIQLEGLMMTFYFFWPKCNTSVSYV